MRFQKLWEDIYQRHPVVILQAKSKKPICKKWPELQVSIEEVRQAFREGLNLGVRTDNLVVRDDDDIEHARKFFRDYRDKIKVIVKTPNDGCHFYFQGDSQLGNRVRANGEFDIRSGKGGYVVAAGSQTSKPYHYVTGYDRLDELEAFPLQLPTSTGQQRRFDRTGDLVARSVAYVASIPGEPEGNRDNKMFYVACKLMEFGLTKEQAYGILLSFANRCEPPYDNKLVFRKLLQAEERLNDA